jgi:hypothetical protein
MLLFLVKDRQETLCFQAPDIKDQMAIINFIAQHHEHHQGTFQVLIIEAM